MVDFAVGEPAKIGRAAWTSLLILTFLYVLYFIDKQIFALLTNTLEGELGFSDTQIGVLQGFVYATPYSIGLLIMGILVDRYPRRLLLAGGVLLWSLAAAASGLATSFQSMALARMFVGLGEAAMVPVGMSILASLFPRDRLSMATGVFYSGTTLGGVVALLLGGAALGALVRSGGMTFPFLGHVEPWRAGFLLTGLPGVAAAWLAFAIPIDDRGRTAIGAYADKAAGRSGFVAYLRANWRYLACYCAAYTVMLVTAFTNIAWAAPYFGRAFHWDHEVIGAVVATGMGFAFAGNILWGHLSDHMVRRGRRDAVFRVFIGLVLAGIPLCAAAFLVRNPMVCVPAFALGSMVYNGFGCLMSPLQLAAPAHLRGRLTGLFALVSGLVGLGIGPALAGLLTDHLFHDRNMLGSAIVISIAGSSVIMAALLGLARSGYVRALAAQNEGIAA